MTHLIPLRPAHDHRLAPEARRPEPGFRKLELSDRSRAAYIEVGCPTCAHPSAVTVSQLKDVTRSVVVCDGCGISYKRDQAVSLTLLSAIGRNPRSAA